MKRQPAVLTAIVAVAGLTASAAALVDHVRGAATFCAADGCATVQASAWAAPLGVPLPALGLGYFALLLLALAVRPRGPTHRALAVVGAAVGVGLIAVQGFALGAWCRLCLVADLAAIAHAALVLGGRAGWPRVRPRVLAPLAAAGGLVLALAPRGGEVAPETAARGTPTAPAGVAAVVDFIDFECPHCRAVHARLDEAIAAAGVPVVVERRMVPLAIHRGALHAALAWCAADNQGRGDDMADALFGAPVDRLTREGCAAVAADLGLDLARYRRDVDDPATHQRIDADRAHARAAAVRGLPTLLIGEQRLAGGGVTVAQLVSALRRAADG